MASSAFPALAINTQGESPINLLGKVEQIKSAQQSQQMGQIQLQEARLKQQSQQAIMKAWTDNQGDPDKTLQAVVQSGKALPEDVTALQTHFVDLKTKAAVLSEDQLKVQTEQNGVLYNALKGYQALPVEQRTPDALKGVMSDLAGKGIPIDKYVPVFQKLAQDSSDAVLKPLEIGLVGQDKVYTEEKAQREALSAPTVSQAQAKTAAELTTAQANAVKAQRELDNMPTAAEAHTQRAATLLETRAQAQKALADAAKTRAETILSQQEPVEGTNATGQRQVLPRAIGAKILTQITPLNADQFNKESMLSTRFGQVAQNYGKYESAIREAGPITHTDDIAQVIADQALGNNPGHVLGLIPSSNLVASKEVSKVTADAWNRLTPDERHLAAAYLQVKGGIITYNKAVDDTGRANETALSLEAANIPSPLEQKSVALQRLQNNKDNIKAIVPAIPKFDHLVDPLEYLKEGEKTPLRQVTAGPSQPVINFAP